jgi:hypothetical protein
MLKSTHNTNAVIFVAQVFLDMSDFYQICPSVEVLTTRAHVGSSPIMLFKRPILILCHGSLQFLRNFISDLTTRAHVGFHADSAI